MVHEMIHLCFDCFHYYAKTAMHSVLVRKRAFTHNHRLKDGSGSCKEGDAEVAEFANKVTIERNLLERFFSSQSLGSSLIIIQILYDAHVVIYCLH